MKKFFCTILFISLLTLFLCGCNNGGQSTESPQTDITAAPTTTPASTTTQPTATLPSTQLFTLKYTVATPYGGTVEGNSTQTLDCNTPSSEITAVAADGYEFTHWSDGSKDPVRKGDIIDCDTEFYAFFQKIVADIAVPTISITTDSGEWIASKEYVTAKIKVEGTAGGIFDGEFTTQIKGRGNSSWSSKTDPDNYSSKNSYRLKLDEKQKFLGIGNSKNRDWVLNSCKFDASLLRNWIGYSMGNMLSGIDYSAECTWAHVYLNGNYRGVYMVTEHVEVAKDRIEVDEKTEKADNGFFVELDMRGHSDGELGVDYFYIDGFAENEDNKREWVIKSDLSEDPQIAAEQFEFIKNYIQQVHNAIEKGDRSEIESLIDIDSFVDMFICSEFSKDVDVNTASFFMYKESGGKLCLTCPWDYDFGFGTYGVATSATDLVSETKSGNQWFRTLILQKWFMELVYDRMLEIEKEVFDLMHETVAMGQKLTECADMNAERWDIYGNHYHGYVSYETSANLYCYEDHIVYLYNWMYRRWENMMGVIEFYANFDINDL